MTGREASSAGMVPIPRVLLRDVATYLYNHGEDMLREALERYDNEASRKTPPARE